MELKRNLQLSMLLALMMIISLVESMLPFLNGMIPGVKLGLSNSIVMLCLYVFSFKEALTISILRVFLMGILRTGLFSVTFFFSLSGALLSVLMMLAFKKTTKLSIIGVSIVGSVSHSIGQLLMAGILLKMTTILNYIPVIILFAIPTGIIVGIVSKEFVKLYQNS